MVVSPAAGTERASTGKSKQLLWFGIFIAVVLIAVIFAVAFHTLSSRRQDAESELMIRAGLYGPGSDARLDEAVRIFPQLDTFFTRKSPDAKQSFSQLSEALGPVSARPG